MALGVVLLLGAVALVWVGGALDRSDVAGMEGGELLLFSLVPIRPFAWVMAAVFAALGAWIMVRAPKH